MRSRTSWVRKTRLPPSTRYGTPAVRRARSSALSPVRAGSRIATSRTARARTAPSRVLHLPALVDDGAARGGHVRRLGPADVPRVGRSAGAAHHADAGAGERGGPLGDDRDVRGLQRRSCSSTISGAEDRVDPVEDHRSRTGGSSVSAGRAPPASLHARRSRRRSRCRRGGSGRSTASGRRRRRAARPARAPPVRRRRRGGTSAMLDLDGSVSWNSSIRSASKRRRQQRARADGSSRSRSRAQQDQVVEDRRALAPPPCRVLQDRTRHRTGAPPPSPRARAPEALEHRLARRLGARRAPQSIASRLGQLPCCPIRVPRPQVFVPAVEPARARPLVRVAEAVEQRQQLLDSGQELVVARHAVEREPPQPAVVVGEDVPVGGGRRGTARPGCARRCRRARSAPRRGAAGP